MKIFTVKKLVLALSSLAAIGLAGHAQAAATFTINPLAPGVSTTTFPTEASFQADSIGGISSELLHNTSSGTTGMGYLEFTSFSLNSSAVSPFTTGLLGAYNLYLLFQLTAAGPIGTTQTLTTLNFQVFLDPKKDDSFAPATVTGNVGSEAAVGNTSDDTLIGFGSLTNPGGTATLNSGGVALNALDSFALCTGAGTAKIGNTSVPGSVTATNTTTNATIGTYGCKASPTGLGTTGYFTSPIPFYQLAFSEFNNTASSVTNSQDGTLSAIGGSTTGSIDFVPVPEPTSIALLGIAAVGMGVSLRRRKAA